MRLWLLILPFARAELVKVVILARHGNRASNPQVPYVCPAATAMISEFDEPVFSKQRAALSHVGMAENWQSGRFIKERYIGKGKLLESAAYYDDGSTFFFSERMNRNIASAEALADGLYPRGEGQPGFLPTRPQIVPILTSQPFSDTLMNLPRDGPCKKAYNKDREEFNKEYERDISEANRDELLELGEICGFNFATVKETVGKSLAWAVKAAADAFNMARNEGIDFTINGKLSEAKLNKIVAMSSSITNAQRFGKEHQMTYWIGRFIDDALFANLRDPGHLKKEELEVVGVKLKSKQPWVDSPHEFFLHNRLLMFMNHRELMQSVQYVFDMKDLLARPVPAGSMILWELHRDDEGNYLRLFHWEPSRPTWAEKNAYLASGKDVGELYANTTGTSWEVFPEVCPQKGRCTLHDLENAWKRWTEQTGTWDKVCGLDKQMTLQDYLANMEETADDGDDEDGYRTAFEAQVFGLSGKLGAGGEPADDATKTNSTSAWVFCLAVAAAFGGLSLIARRFRSSADAETDLYLTM